MKFFATHKALIVIWLCAITVSGFSGYKYFFEPAKTEIITSDRSAPPPVTVSSTVGLKNNLKKVNTFKPDLLSTSTSKIADNVSAQTTSIKTLVTTSTPTPSTTPDQLPNQISVELQIENTNFKLAIPEKSTAYDLLKLAQEKSLLSFSGKNFLGMGFFLEEINGKPSDQKNKFYWIYYINGKKATEGISNYLLKQGDIISWQYEKESI